MEACSPVATRGQRAFERLLKHFYEYEDQGVPVPSPHVVNHDDLVALELRAVALDTDEVFLDHAKDTKMMGVSLVCEEGCPWR